MNIERDNLKKARELLNELETLESALNVSSNYDVQDVWWRFPYD